MSEETIRSLTNARVKELVRLRQARARKELGLTRIDGVIELQRALDARLVPSCIYHVESAQGKPSVGELIMRAAARGTKLQAVSDEVYEKIRYGDRDEGICATIAWQPRPLAELPAADNALYLVLEGLEKPGNLGAILRTADAAGVTAVILCDAAVDATNPNAVRASLGTIFTVPVFVGTSVEAKRLFATRSVAAVSAVVGAARSYADHDYRHSCAMVLGAEHDGLTDAWRSENPVGIPMAGHADSLNVSVSAAVLLFEAVRQRRNPAPNL